METAGARPVRARLLPLAALLAAMASFQLGASFAERLFPIVGPAGAAALRLLGSSLILGLVRRPWRGLRAGRRWGGVIAYGLTLGAMNTLFYLSLQRLPLGIAVAIEFLGPLGVAMAASRRPIDLVWIAMALGGLALLLPLGGAARGLDLTGVLFALGAGVCWALYIVFGRRAGQAHGANAAGLGIFIATLVFLPAQVAIQGPSLFALAALPIALLVALFSSALPYSLEMYALTRMPQRTFGTLMSLEPAVGALAGLLLLGQRLAPLQWAGIAGVVLASAGAAATGERVTAPEGP
jgi:inner membrane transporter RhtA